MAIPSAIDPAARRFARGDAEARRCRGERASRLRGWAREPRAKRNPTLVAARASPPKRFITKTQRHRDVCTLRRDVRSSTVPRAKRNKGFTAKAQRKLDISAPLR